MQIGRGVKLARRLEEGSVSHRLYLYAAVVPALSPPEFEFPNESSFHALTRYHVLPKHCYLSSFRTRVDAEHLPARELVSTTPTACITCRLCGTTPFRRLIFVDSFFPYFLLFPPSPFVPRATTIAIFAHPPPLSPVYTYAHTERMLMRVSRNAHWRNGAINESGRERNVLRVGRSEPAPGSVQFTGFFNHCHLFDR